MNDDEASWRDDGMLARDDGTLARDDGMLARDDGTLARDDGTLARDDGMLARDDGMLARDDVGAKHLPPWIDTTSIHHVILLIGITPIYGCKCFAPTMAMIVT
jgi:hypothetical protein